MTPQSSKLGLLLSSGARVSRSFFVSLLIVVLCNQKADAGFIVGNGGDLVWCQTERGDRAFVLDFVQAKTMPDDPLEEEVDSSKIALRLHEVWPGLAANLDGFLSSAIEQIFHAPNYQRPFIWRPGHLAAVEDENLLLQLPTGCYDKDGKPRLQQAVIQDRRTQSIILQYSLEALTLLKKDSQQWSFLLIHEWLWAFSSNAVVVRDLNHFLHSRSFFQLPADTVRGRLVALGFDSAAAPVPALPLDISQAVLNPSDYDFPGCWVLPDHGFSVTYHNSTPFILSVYFGSALMDTLGPGQSGHFRSYQPGTVTVGWRPGEDDNTLMRTVLQCQSVL